MTTSISEIIRIEKYLAGQLRADDRLVFEGRLIVDNDLRRNVFLQRLIYRLARLYYRKLMKAEVARVHERLFADPAKAPFRESVLQHFNS